MCKLTNMASMESLIKKPFENFWTKIEITHYLIPAKNKSYPPDGT